MWGSLLRLHPFSVVVEPDDDWDGQIQMVVSNDPYVGPTGQILATLSDPISTPYEFSKDAPYQWLGVIPIRLDVGRVRINVIASPYSRNFQP